jgi:hypothetical protein
LATSDHLPPRFKSSSLCSSSQGARPTSTRAQSLSPSTIAATMRPSPNAVHSLEGGLWDQGIIIGSDEQPNHHHHAPTHTSSTSTAYPLSSMPHVKSLTSQQFSSYQSAAAAQSSLSQTTLPGTMYMPTAQGTQNFAHTTDCTLGEVTHSSATGSGGASGRGSYSVHDLREDQQHFPPYSQPSYSGGPEGALHYTAQQQRKLYRVCRTFPIR